MNNKKIGQLEMALFSHNLTVFFNFITNIIEIILPFGILRSSNNTNTRISDVITNIIVIISYYY